MTALTDLLIGGSAVLLYLSESRIRSRNSTLVPIFQNLSLFMSVFYESIMNVFFTKVFLRVS